MKASNSGSGTFGIIESWTVNETVTPFAANDSTTSVGDAVLVVTRKADTDLVEGNRLGLSQDPILAFKPELPVTANKVTMTGPALASVAADSAFGAFISSRLRIPGIESGLPLAALDVACQAGGMKRQTGALANDNYWSLQGHSVGFTGDGDIIEPTSVDRSLRSANGGATYTGGETVLYQEITGHLSAENFSPEGYPRTIRGDTVPFARERTYVKFTVNPSGAGVHPVTFSLAFGPAFRKFGSTENVANTTSISVVFNPLAAGGTLTGTIRYQDAAGASQTATANIGGSLAPFARDKATTIVLEISSELGALKLRTIAANETSTSPLVTIQTPVLTAAASTLYSRQFVVTQANTSGGGLRDLVVARSSTDRWSSFLSPTYALPSAVTSEAGAGTVAGSPIAAFDGELWDYVKQVCSARRVELASTPSGIRLRQPGARVVDLSKFRASASRTISGAASARKISVMNQRTKALPATPTEVLKADQVYSVGVGETKTVTLDLPEGVRFVHSPRPWYNSKVTNGIYIASPEYLDGYNDLEFNQGGSYYITGADTFPVNPAQWTDYGGRVTVSMKEGKALLTLTGPVKDMPNVKGPFSIGESAAGSDFAMLRLFGTGVTNDPVEVVLPSGAGKKETRVEKGSTVTNVALGTIGEVYDASTWIAQRVAGPTVMLTAAVPMGTLAGWGLVAGSLVTWENNLFRIDSAGHSTSGVTTLSCSKLTRLSDMPGRSRTLSQYQADYAGMTSHDYSIRPLAPLKP